MNSKYIIYNNMSLLSVAFPDYKHPIASSSAASLPAYKHTITHPATGGYGGGVLPQGDYGGKVLSQGVLPHSATGGYGGGVLPHRLINKYALSIEHTGLKSTVVSPYSLFSILFPLYVASDGETHFELGRYLQLPNLDSGTAQTVITDTVKLLGDADFCKYVNILYNL